MKKLQIILILSSVLFTACNFSKGTKKDLRTGLSFTYNGFRVDDVLLVDPTGKPMTDNKVQLNTRVAVVAVGISNYALKDGKAYPGMMLLVTDKKGTPVLNAADLFNGDQGHPPTEATELHGDITIGKPMVVGETYHVKLRIWDKVKTDNEINIETNLVVE
ncbi:hypothetical protein GCM10023149_15570 [Mucilaginibacter gynuensis]|uniref:DUF4625 domain-containing protein n=1 Tax=Mucilaginibacter gynuensis TaxID=1302236 RepID=A0ABP8G5C6_9SPHI